ncbi:MAG TPA: amidohydrolase family protein, partial [Verrucomicrobiae bacterium]
SFSLDEYVAEAKGTGITKTVFVECDVDEPHALAEAQRAHQLSDKNQIIVGIVAGCRPEKSDFPDSLELLLELPKLRGLRRVLHVVPDVISQSALFAKNINRLAEPRLTFDLCVLARQLPLAIALVQKCPEIQFILDHCGVPDIKGRALEPWRSDLKKLSLLPNVACKVSGIIAYCDPNKNNVEALRPWMEHTLECFGWDRLVWGGDWPVCNLTASLKQWVDTIDALLSWAKPFEREAFFYKNAERIYRV